MTLQKLLTLDLQYLGSNSTPIFQFLFKDSIVSPPSAPFILECHLHLSKSKHQLQKLTQSYFQYLIIFIYLLCVCLFLWMSVSTIYATVIWKKVLNKEAESAGKCRMCGQSVKVKDKVGSGCLVGVLMFSRPQYQLVRWEGTTDRQRERGEKKETPSAATHDHVGGEVVGGIACVWNASEAFWLSSLLVHSLSLKILPLSGPPAVPSLSRPVGSQRLLSGRGAVYSQGCRVNQWNALLHCRSVGWLLLHHYPALRTHKPQAPRLSREPESVEMKDNRPACAGSCCNMHGDHFANALSSKAGESQPA